MPTVTALTQPAADGERLAPSSVSRTTSSRVGTFATGAAEQAGPSPLAVGPPKLGRTGGAEPCRGLPAQRLACAPCPLARTHRCALWSQSNAGAAENRTLQVTTVACADDANVRLQAAGAVVTQSVTSTRLEMKRVEVIDNSLSPWARICREAESRPTLSCAT